MVKSSLKWLRLQHCAQPKKYRVLPSLSRLLHIVSLRTSILGTRKVLRFSPVGPIPHVGPFLFAWNRTKIRHSTSVIPRRMIGVVMADEQTIRALGEQAYLFHLLVKALRERGQMELVNRDSFGRKPTLRNF